ncbi:acetate/propionate family kinase [Kerstersia gyiorum]|uniref:acetate/propionate family kinase n=1 Tax=Kerstersia gyiorum TaxID=206506 RepID=UPI00214F9A88|nr:acetate/propionate family kinase [Kerstersia gyiorum]MCR4158894.1 acetate/propionate family kinase [Kerstersia gyiorum]
MDDTILVVNAGSSSFKFRLYGVPATRDPAALEPLLDGQVSGIGGRQPHFKVKAADGQRLADQLLTPEAARDIGAAQELLSNWLADRLDNPPVAIGHRVVHGGPDFTEPVRVDAEVLQQLHALVPLAPLHQPSALEAIEVIRRIAPDMAQVACFDTAFHRTHSGVADRYAIPEAMFEQGVRRYGFHGLSYEFIQRRMREIAPALAAGRLIVAHLGSGSSACAMKDGLSVDSTMGFTALDGLPMSTRPGRLDAGVVLWMMERGMTPEQVQRVLYKESGMLGLSGISADMREIAASDTDAARRAREYFAWRTAEGIAGLCVAIGGLDALVFTAGVGENDAAARALICERLDWLGVRLDATRNQGCATLISAEDSRVAVYVVPTNEELVIAEHTLALLR